MASTMTDEEMLQLINDNMDAVIRYSFDKWPDRHLLPAEWPFVSIRDANSISHFSSVSGVIIVANFASAVIIVANFVSANGNMRAFNISKLIEYINAKNSRPILK